MIDNKEIRKVGNAILKVLGDRKGFDWWFDELDSTLKSEIKMSIGRAAIKAIKNEK